MSTMRTITQDEFGGPEVLHIAQAPVPEPIGTEIRVRVVAAGINPVDAKTRAGGRLLGTPPFVLGWDVAGVVDAVGFGVNRFRVGDAVLGMPWFPRPASAYAEYVTAPSHQFVAKPDALSWAEAGALPLAGLTALQSLDAAGLTAGRTVLVLAGAGGVGHLAVQIAHARGARVLATASPNHHDELITLGADRVVDYHTESLADLGEPLDVVLDLLGGAAAVDALPLVRAGGAVVTVPSGLSQPLKDAAAATGTEVREFFVEPDEKGLDELAALAGRGLLHPRVAGRYPLDRAADAHRELEGGHVAGKIVLDVTEP